MAECKYDAKRECFAYRKVRGVEKCMALKRMYCKEEDCKFFRNQKDYDVDKELNLIGETLWR